MNVHDMNGKTDQPLQDIVALKLLEEIEQGEDISQRSLSNKLNIALGLVNTYIKHLVKKGYVRVKQFPKVRYKYLLTPEGMAEKSRLVYKHLSYYNNLFKTVRSDCLNLFNEMGEKGTRTVVFCGVDEVTEIAYLSLRETSIKLVGVFDDDAAGQSCVGFTVLPLNKITETDFDSVFLSSIKKKNSYKSALNALNIESEKIFFAGNGQ
jgi:predicted transcriptional regulator